MDAPPQNQPAPPSEKPLAGMRVLVLFGGDRIYGSELSNLEVFRNMGELGLEARFITRTKHGKAEIEPALDRMGIGWTNAPFGYHWGKYIFGRHFYYFFINLCGLIVTNWVLWREVRRWKPTHLYCMNWIFFSYAMPAVFFLKLPLVYRAGDEFPEHTGLHRRLFRKLLGRADGLVCISQFIERQCLRLGARQGRTRVIYNFPPVRREAAREALPPLPAGAVLLAYVGQVSEAKGVVVLFEAVKQLVQKGTNVVLWVVGDPPHDPGWFDRLKKSVAEAGLAERIVFLGHRKDVASVYAAADVHVCPSVRTEALSNVVLEAKREGRPSVVFPTGGLPELIEHGVDGYVCRDKSSGALVEGIEFFANDEGRRKAAGLAAHRSLEEKFGLARYRAAWAGIFQDAMKRS